MTGRALLLYAISAVCSTAASAFLLLSTASYASGDAATAAQYNNVGFPILIVSVAVSIAALALLTRSFVRIAKASRDQGIRVSAILHLSRGLLSVFWLLLVLTILVLLLSLYKLTLEQIRVLRLGTVLLSTCAAVVLLAAVANPVVRLARKKNLSIAWAATVLGFIAIIGEGLAGGWNSVASSRSLDWLTFGGYPLLNISPLFGPMIAISSLLLSRSYRSLGVDSVTLPESP